MDQINGLLRKVYRGLDTAKSKRLGRLLDKGEWTLLQREALSHPSVYRFPAAYRKDAIAVELTRKLLLPGDTALRKQAAVDTFWQAEAECAATNARLSPFINLQGPFGDSDETLVAFIGAWRDEVGRVLGRCPAVLTPRFSGGSTLSDQGKRVTIPDKLSSVPTSYCGGDSFLHRRSLNGTPFFHAAVRRVRSNRFFTVPKDSLKDRGCCVEASLAVALQLDAGRHITERIEKHYQVDMTRVPEYHKWLAQIASRHGTFATIDLSNASDTVCSALIKLLLPSDWYRLLNSLRAKSTIVGHQTVWLNKFSSMGNGFTFPLETLVFQTLARTLGSKCSSVFGDDIVIETEHARAMVAALRFFGFTPNAKKTFCEGPFRESCGGDYFLGEPVRAHYLKELPSEPQHWVSLANGLRRADPELAWLRAAWRYCVDQVPVGWRNFCADTTLGDFAFYDPAAQPTIRFHPWPEHIKMFGRRVGDYRPMWRGMVPVAKTFSLDEHFSPDVAVMAAVLGVSANVSTRDSISGWKVGWISALC